MGDVVHGLLVLAATALAATALALAATALALDATALALAAPQPTAALAAPLAADDRRRTPALRRRVRDASEPQPGHWLR